MITFHNQVSATTPHFSKETLFSIAPELSYSFSLRKILTYNSNTQFKASINTLENSAYSYKYVVLVLNSESHIGTNDSKGNLDQKSNKLLISHFTNWWVYITYIILTTLVFYFIYQIQTKSLKKNKASNNVFNKSPNGMCIVNNKLQIISINNSYNRITGFTHNGTQDKYFVFATNKETSKKIYKTVTSTLSKTSNWNGELKINLTSNKILYLETSITSLVDNKELSSNRFLITITDITKRRIYEKQLEHLSYIDNLTGLLNRTSFLKETQSAITLAQQNNQQFAIVYVDLNDFKKVNDHFGHSYGDELLKILGKRFKRSMDENIKIARFGGDEFCLLLYQEKKCTLIKSIKKLNYKFTDIFNKSFIIEGREIIITPAIGVSIYPEHSKNIEELMKFADIAMYISKETKNDRYTLYDEKTQTSLYPRVELEIKLKHALENNLICGYLQPQYDIKTNKVIGFEVLARWITKQNKIISPEIFIGIAEKSGIINQLFLHLLQETTQNFSQSDEKQTFKLSFNISPNQLYNHSLLKKLHKIVTNNKILPSNIVLEITETALIYKPKQAKLAMLSLKKLGYQIALDDFGTGHSSLTHLKDFPVDIIKIDKSFISTMLSNKNVYYIVESIIILSQKMGIPIIAEGVTTVEEVKTLKSLQCDIIQGYYYGKPKPFKVYIK